MKIDIIIITYNCPEYALGCIKSIYETCPGESLNIIVVDNASTDETVSSISGAYPGIRIIRNRKNLGYAAAVNIGMAAGSEDYAIVSNADVVFHPGTIRALVEFLEKYEEVGVVGPQQVYGHGGWEYSYGDIPGMKSTLKDLFFLSSLHRGIRKALWKKIRIDKYPREVEYVDGGVLALRRRAYERVNGFDEDFFFFSEEADFCYRVYISGFLVMFLPTCTVTHFRGGSTSKAPLEQTISMMAKSKMLFVRKHNSRPYCHIYKYLSILQNGFQSGVWRVLSLAGKGNFGAKCYNKHLFFRHVLNSFLGAKV